MIRFLALLALCFTTSRIVCAQGDVPNILWIVSEDNTTLLGCYGDNFATTPHLDQFARESVLFQNAFATAPVCAPSRCSLITGMYPTSLGTENMRSTYPVPSFVKFFPRYLREAGYYATNNAKKDYNTIDQTETWDESSDKATYKNRKKGQPFFAVFNLGVSHESSIHQWNDSLHHDPEKVPLPPYHPNTKEFKHDWAQYYDKLETMDAQVGKLLKELEDEGLADNTIVFYYSDNGGVLARSKRFMYESGVHVPLIIRFPKKYQHLSSNKPGSKTDRPVSFVDFAPTVLSLAGIQVPGHMQGQVFLGKQQQKPRDYAYSFRGRMDERIDLIRSVRDKRYRYIRNYMPHRLYGENVSYLWLAPSARSWEAEFKAGRLNDVQSVFWKPKPPEELYDVLVDPHNIHNLAQDPAHQKVLLRLREANKQWLSEVKDAGFIPEAIAFQLAGQMPLHTYTHDGKTSLARIHETADLATLRDPGKLGEIIKRLNDPDPSVRYWAATGCTILKEKSIQAKPILQQLLNDPETSFQIAAAEALYYVGEKEQSIGALTAALQNPNLFARLQALNVLQTFGEGAAPAIDQAKGLIHSEPKQFGYDERAAQTLVNTYNK